MPCEQSYMCERATQKYTIYTGSVVCFMQIGVVYLQTMRSKLPNTSISDDNRAMNYCFSLFVGNAPVISSDI